MNAPPIRTMELDPRVIRWTLIGAQLLALIAYFLGTAFLLRPNGGTLFLFTIATPLLILAATLALAGVALYRYLRRSSLFAFALFEPGDLIVQKGDQGDFAYFIQQGEVEVIQREQDVETVIAHLRNGEHFGETALISDAPHPATVRARTRVRVAMLGKRKFLHMLRFVHPSQGDVVGSMNRRATKQAAERAKSASRHREDNGE